MCDPSLSFPDAFQSSLRGVRKYEHIFLSSSLYTQTAYHNTGMCFPFWFFLKSFEPRPVMLWAIPHLEFMNQELCLQHLLLSPVLDSFTKQFIMKTCQLLVSRELPHFCFGATPYCALKLHPGSVLGMGVTPCCGVPMIKVRAPACKTCLPAHQTISLSLSSFF